MKISSIITLVVTSILFFGCKTDFSVNGEYQKEAIIHSIIDHNDTIHYIKINKTFLGDGNAFDFAAVPDSNLFSSVEGTVEEILNGTVIRAFDLDVIDTIMKDPDGVFSQEQKIYFFKTVDQKLNKDATLRLRLNLDNGDRIVTAETGLTSGLEITSPNDFTPLSLAEASIQDNSDYRTQSISFKTGNAEYFDLRLIFRYNEFIGSQHTIKEFEWKIDERALEDLSLNAGIAAMFLSGKTFYEQVAAKIPVDPTVTKRTVHSFDFILTGASQDLVNYIAVSQPSSTLAQSKPTFTNISGGLGIFTSRSKEVRTRLNYVPNGSTGIRILSLNSTRQLCQGQITTSELMFCSPIPEDQNQPFFCN